MVAFIANTILHTCSLFVCLDVTILCQGLQTFSCNNRLKFNHPISSNLSQHYVFLCQNFVFFKVTLGAYLLKASDVAGLAILAKKLAENLP